MNRWSAALGTALLATWACSGEGPTGVEPGPNPREVAAVSVFPATVQVYPGDTVRLQATPLNAGGQPITDVVVTWSSTEPSVASVSMEGLVTAHDTGSVQVRATAGGKWGGSAVAVARPFDPGPQPGPVTVVELDVTTATVAEGGSVVITATPRDAEGDVVEDRVVVWTSSNTAVAWVNPFGTVSTIRVGEAEIEARVDGASAEATITVVADYGYDLLYDQSDGVGIAPEIRRLDIRTADATPDRLFPDGRWAHEAAVSPDGSRIAFTVYSPSGSNVWVADLDGSDALQLTDVPGIADKPSWSPNGRTIAYRRWLWSQGEGADIWTVHADGTDHFNVTNDNVGLSHDGPAWSPLGDRIVYSRLASGTMHLWTIRPDGTDRRQLTFGDVADVHAAWSPNASRIVFERYGAQPGSDGELYVLDVATGGVGKLLALPYGQFNPAFSPDGRLIAFSSQVAGQLQVFTVWPDGSRLAQRTHGDREASNPAWWVVR